MTRLVLFLTVIKYLPNTDKAPPDAHPRTSEIEDNFPDIFPFATVLHDRALNGINDPLCMNRWRSLPVAKYLQTDDPGAVKYRFVPGPTLE